MTTFHGLLFVTLAALLTVEGLSPDDVTAAVDAAALTLSTDEWADHLAVSPGDGEEHRMTRRQSPVARNVPAATASTPAQDLERNGVTTGNSYRGKEVRVYVENKFRPVFTRCESTKLLEAQSPGTIVNEVTATDNDTAEAGQIYYTILRAGSEKEFDIDPNTGVIRSSKAFDRDEPVREKIAYVTVKATDKGTPPLETICTFNVTIEDINDNPPMFDKSSYEESVPRDLEVNRNVMRLAATDIDFDENARISYSLTPALTNEAGYFAIDRTTGIIQLKQRISQNEGYKFRLTATATDQGKPALSSSVNVVIAVASSKIKPPSFINPASAPVYRQENDTSYKVPLATFEAQSNIDEPDLFFELAKGQTQQTNSDETFRINERGNSVDIFLSKPLDFETVTHYILTVRVKNAAGVAAETVLEIFVTDVNDESPTFIAVDSGSVLENSAPNTYVLKIQATDKDGTYPNNWVRYQLRDNTDKFDIDVNSGEIRTKVPLDREERKSYALTVVAYDGSESSLTQDGRPNERAKRFQIEVADVNDNPPFFPQAEYFAEIAENADIGAKVSELNALDNDTDSQLIYDIVSGNTDNVFSIESQTGLLKVHQPLDYEKTKAYLLVVVVDDGKQKASTQVHVKIINVNDNKPQFENTNPTPIHGILEQQVPTRHIMTVRATDPDYDASVATGPMKIYYTLASSNAEFFRINEQGELFIVRELDRDLPSGRKDWSVFVVAQDELDGIRLENTLEVIVNLEDINDNAPFLDMPQPVVWYENQPPGHITVLKASDYDEPKNGPPFTMKMADTADDVVRTSFRVEGSPDTQWSLVATRTFDREERKRFAVPIVISDSGKPQSLTATSTLMMVIGDVNDNPMYDGSSSITVYNFKGLLPDTEIGRVYVDDKDDWDLPDKTFSWHPDVAPSNHFAVNQSGHIIIKYGAPAGLHSLKFHVVDNHRKEEADAKVDVHVKVIPEEAVRRSGSLRLSDVTAESFVEAAKDQPLGSASRKDLLRRELARIVGAREDNVDIFTVLKRGQRHNHTVDVRYSAHGSPYYDPVRLNGLVSGHHAHLEATLNLRIDMIGINECLNEKGECEGSCTNRLNITEQPYRVSTNTSSFVGVDARVTVHCVCDADLYLPPSGDACTKDKVCLNGGTCTGNPARPCKCPDGYEGPLCEGLDVSFDGTGWAWYDPLPTCSTGNLSLVLTAQTANGLLLYAGPRAVPNDLSVTDFLAVELREGSPVLHLDLGSGTRRLEFNQAHNLVDGKAHVLEVLWSERKVEMVVDGCRSNQVHCSASAPLSDPHKFLNVGGPLQLGGTDADLSKMRIDLGWGSIPDTVGFSGCLSNVIFNGKTYNLVAPALSKNVTFSCEGMSLPVTTGALGWELIVGLVVCFLVLLVLIAAALAYRRRHGRDNLKEFHDDIRENIINYSDEGGGEGDMTGYDLSVLRMTPDGKPLIARTDDYGKLLKDEDLRPRRVAPGEVPDISQFLDDNKGRVDRDPDALPYDDLRHYAYEGDGNSQGSLSSLASGTEDGDLDFECLSDFGPRFKKLADMYGDHSSESDDDDHAPQSSGNESWC